MLEIKNFSKTYPEGKKAVSNLTITVEDGDLYGFIGHNGAGKTTTIKSIVGILPFEEGDIIINGISVKENPLECKKMLAYIPDNPDLYEFLTGMEYINFVSNVYDEDVSKEDIINVDEMVIINPSLIEKLISKKCKKTLERILKFISFIYDDDETGEESVELALNEIAKFKELLDTKYKEYMKEKEYKLMIKKLEILENEVKLRKLYLNSKENREKKSKGR